MNEDAEAVERLLAQMKAEWEASDRRMALRQAEHDGWMRGFRDASKTGREHAWVLYCYGFGTGAGLAFLLTLMFTRHL